MQKRTINLLQDELFPKQALWTLKRVALLWLLVLVLMISWLFASQTQVNQRAKQLAKVSAQKKERNDYLARLEKQVKENQPDPLLQEKLATIKLLLANKKLLHEKLTDVTSTYASGFSSAMTELSELHHKDISLQQVIITPEHMMFSGLAKKPDVVPAWLAGFEQSTFLSGQLFGHFTLTENEDKVTQFTVSSTANFERVGG